MLIAILDDVAFRRKGNLPYDKRWTVRAFAYNEEGKLVFLRVVGSDAFGKRNHLETAGGGVENDESLEETLYREILEETGYECEIIEEIGKVVDHYNLINRETISTYFAVKLTNYTGKTNLSEMESTLIKGIEAYSEEEALKILSQGTPGTVNELVMRRDYYALKHYLKYRK